MISAPIAINPKGFRLIFEKRPIKNITPNTKVVMPRASTNVSGSTSMTKLDSNMPMKEA